ncbi:hypothetical protein PIB30_094887 [Stylosanthes scabra]|uniref:Uncharacterized protein n=1 Tax=Stylosanthes scabra TaxID=79078 RepID=A0ABU6UUD2_9FABA|nr:hypothetical protein [Stylosanthes scabra]
MGYNSPGFVRCLTIKPYNHPSVIWSCHCSPSLPPEHKNSNNSETVKILTTMMDEIMMALTIMVVLVTITTVLEMTKMAVTAPSIA